MAYNAISTWSLELVPGKKYEIVAAADLHITNAALGDELAEETGRSVIKATVHEQPAQLDSDSEDEAGEAGEPFDTVLCSLRAGQTEQTTLDLVFLIGQKLEFQVTGKNKVYLLGNYIDQYPDDSDDEMDMPPYDDSDLEEAYRLQDVSSDVEVMGDDIDMSDDEGRFEEINDAPPAKPASSASAKPVSKKRSSDAAGLKDGKEGKKANKGENGAAKKSAAPPSSSSKPKSKGGDKPKSQLNGASAPASKGGDKPKSKKQKA
ncbi:hypothetical protein EXIGLDRAFT_731900 [Exidia glandulosa HHB12029]|uniref:Nucleoplasmin-like domain-containing protein n=1 Tax=Exidia glandulosa HHB12029 TaxID=1314781 RepID=A0A165BQH5_EXIGL|nr:hypothetical protein EXIGLDRAFT_731900 [Exidia glandulosa HHB12029]